MPLVGRKAALALLALTPAANRIRLFALPAIDHPILRKPTKRTLHKNLILQTSRNVYLLDDLDCWSKRLLRISALYQSILVVPETPRGWPE